MSPPLKTNAERNIRAWQVLGGLPLILYPAVFLASGMALAAPNLGGGSMLVLLFVKSLMIAMLLYPVVYLFCLVKSRRAAKNHKLALRYALLPLGYLLLLIALVAIWIVVDELGRV